MRLNANNFFTTSLVALTALAAGQARAADVAASSTVDAVTVYPDGASVTRIISLDLPAGENFAVLKDFPLALDPSSLRVEGEAGAKLTIGAIDAKPPHQTAVTPGRESNAIVAGLTAAARSARVLPFDRAAG